MTKSDLILRLARHYPQYTVADTHAAVNMILGAMAENLAQGGRVGIRNFGSFDLNYRPPRNARNPKTGAKVRVPAKYAPHFKTGVQLRERANNGRKVG